MSPSDGSRPNVLIIFTDDQRLNGTMDVLPKTRAWFHSGGELASGRRFEGGTFFPNGLVTTPLCAPSRASLFTGRYAHHHGVHGNWVIKGDATTAPNRARGPGRFFQQLESSLPVYLQRAGYRTGIFGRYFALFDVFDEDLMPHPLPGWDEYAVVAPGYSGFDVNENGVRRSIARYSTDYLTVQAEAFLDGASEDDRPWFLYLPTVAPHTPHLPPPRHAEARVPPLDASNPAFFAVARSDKPPWTRTSREDADATEAAWPAYLRTLKSVDDLVDRVMRKLEDLGETNTLAFFSSDHGLQWGEHGLRRKERPYLDSISVPFYMRWPGHVRSDHTDALHVANIDIAPTVIAAVNGAGGPRVNPDPPMDGISLIEDGPAPRTWVLTEHFGAGPRRALSRNYFVGRPPSWASIKTDSFQYIEYYRTYARDPDNPEDVAKDSPEGAATPFLTDYDEVIGREYYDLTSDPHQLDNLLGDDDPTNDPPTNLLHSVLVKDRSGSILPVEVAITRAPEGTADNPGPTDATFAFTSSEPGSTFQCGLDDEPWRVCGAEENFNGLAAGWHTLSVRATAPSGRTSDPVTHRWYAAEGAQKPAAPHAVKPSKGRAPRTRIVPSPTFSPNRSGATFYVVCDPSSTDDVREVRFEGRLSVAGRPPPPFRPCGTQEQRVPSKGLPNDRVRKTYYGLESAVTYTFEARAIELAGNPDPMPASYTWEVGPIQTFSSVPDAATPDVTGKEVRAIVPDGRGGWYVGGEFTAVGGKPRANLAHVVLDPASGNLAVDHRWAPVTDGVVTTLVLCGETLYVGGAFSSVEGVNGEREREGLAALTTAGAVADWDPRATGVSKKTRTTTVRALAVEPGQAPASIYAAVEFEKIGAEKTARLAKLDLANGAADPSWNLDIPDGTIHALAITPGQLYVGGAFASIGGNQRSGLAEIDLLSGAVTDWDPAPAAGDAPFVEALVLRRRLGGLDTILVGGRFGSIGSSPQGRSNAAEVNLSDDGSVTSWDPQIGSQSASCSVRAIVPFFCPHPGEPVGTDPTCSIIVGGEFDTVKTSSPQQAVRRGLAETDRGTGDPSDPRSGSANDWDPRLDGPVLAVACWAPQPRCDIDPGRVLAVGGRFATVGDTPRGRLAFFRAQGSGP